MKYILIIVFILLSVINSQAEKEWKLKYMPEELHQLAKLGCIDSLNCIAIVNTFDFNRIYKSSNQGNSWFEFSSFDRYNPVYNTIRTAYQSFIFDSLNLYMIFTDGAVIDKSIDGGMSFERKYFEELYKVNNVKRFYDITMFTNKIGAAITLPYLLYTSDNWETYTIIDRPDSVFSGGPMYFIDSNNIALIKFYADSDIFMKYNIPNDEWSQYNVGEEIPIGERNKSINDLHFVNDSLIYACGHQFTGVNSFSKDLIWKSTDRGKTWRKLMDQLNNPGFGLVRLSFKDNNHGIAVGNWGKILETLDGGDSWFQHPLLSEFNNIVPEITWAGEYPIYGANSTGFYRLETVTDVEELSSVNKFRVYQSGKNLEIAINDESYATYSFSLYNSSGQYLMTRDVKSSFGFVFEPVELIDLTNGVYFYTISKNNGVEFTGKLVVVE